MKQEKKTDYIKTTRAIRSCLDWKMAIDQIKTSRINTEDLWVFWGTFQKFENIDIRTFPGDIKTEEQEDRCQ